MRLGTEPAQLVEEPGSDAFAHGLLREALASGRRNPLDLATRTLARRECVEHEHAPFEHCRSLHDRADRVDARVGEERDRTGERVHAELTRLVGAPHAPRSELGGVDEVELPRLGRRPSGRFGAQALEHRGASRADADDAEGSGS
ncbi:hypothetical protein QFZ29_000047 [Agromyces albus]|nr:hypothetical protein [Agromyces albus]MDQ0573824.1 hypothetical protein [Agromyces albus]